ncbi:C39 family peptidase [Paenibacillus thermoaerophilus]|uniref:C39 family peptidase n=1 Tax=Paenibacillus thermoaerophilus TaxID=1215385 RepID=A0ABW2V6M1_9BACL|nr:C39 family peptidase [Paenibacillus thermoaerophilus]TMV18747.1 hypothetical protein FE781_02095 [Paenibacillus thermoaerophilus]
MNTRKPTGSNRSRRNPLLQSLKICAAIFLVIGLSFASGTFGLILYGKVTGQYMPLAEAAAAVLRPGDDRSGLTAAAVSPSPEPSAEPAPAPWTKPASARLDAPAIRQHPELPSGCEIVSLTMLLQYLGVDKGKMELVKELPFDPTPMKMSGGRIVSWGDPNTGFVGDVTGKGRGYGVYHGPLFRVLSSYTDQAVDLTGSEFDEVEKMLALGSPVVAWTTINFRVPDKWVTWESPNGPVRATFIEHAVLLTGYDEEHVYVNDPWTGGKDVKVAKSRFVETWEAMGKQAISYKQA